MELFYGVMVFTVLYERTVNLFYSYGTIILALIGSKRRNHFKKKTIIGPLNYQPDIFRYYLKLKILSKDLYYLPNIYCINKIYFNNR